MTTADDRQLNLVATLHYAVAGITAFFSLFPVIHIAIGIAIITGKIPMPGPSQGQPAFPREFGYLFVIMGSMFMGFGLLVSLLVLIAGRKISKRKSYTFCLVTAIIACIFFPFGTALGVFSLITLSKDSVKSAFDQQMTSNYN